MASFVYEDDVVHIPMENLLELDNKLSNLVNHLERAPTMVRVTRLTSEVRNLLGKDWTGIEFLHHLSNLTEAYIPSYKSRSDTT